MKSIKSTLATFAISVLAFAAMSTGANESEEHNVIVEVHKMSDSNTLVDLKINGNAEVFSLPQLEIGEAKDIVTQSGKVIYLTRSEQGLSVSIDGEDIDLPHVGGDMQAHFLKSGLPLHKKMSNSIQVIGDLTEEQIAIIKDGFAAAGVDKEIDFTSGHEIKFFFSGDGEQFENVNEWLNEDGEKIKIIKLDQGVSRVHVQTEVIVLEADEDKN